MALYNDTFSSSTVGTSADTYLKLTTTTAAEAVSISGGVMRFGTTGNVFAVVNSPNAPTSPDQFVSVTVAPSGPAAGSTGVAVRATPQANNINLSCYFARVTATDLAIKTQGTDGKTNTLANVAITGAAGDRLGLKAEGNTLTAYLNGAQVLQFVDTAATCPTGVTGVQSGVVAGVILDDFETGNLATDLPASGYGTAGPPAASAPGQVVGLAAGTTTSASIPLSWTATATATSYLVEYRAGTSGTFTSSGTVTGTSKTITGLAAGTAYQVRVTASNAAGPGPASANLTASTATATTAPPATPPTVTSETGRVFRGIAWNLAGDMILPGELLHTLRHEAFGPPGPVVLPAWLTATGDVTQVAAEGGYISMKATPGNPASLSLTPTILTTSHQAVRIDVDHFRWSTSSPAAASFALTVGDGTVGARAVQNQDDAFARLTNGGGTSDAAMTHMSNSAADRRRLGLLVITATREAFLMDGDQITGERDCAAGWADGVAPVGLTLTSTSGTKEIRLARISVRTYL